jgi:cytochrome c5
MEGEAMRLLKLVVFGGILSAPFLVLAQSKSSPPTQTSTSQKKQAQPPVHANEGERIFAQNCSRCHNAPDGFSPHITGSIVRHMRVRANLSVKEVQELLRFFNP